MDTPPYDRIVEDAVSLAETWQNRANALLTAEEKGIAQQMKGLVTHPPDKLVLTQLIDQSFRSKNTAPRCRPDKLLAFKNTGCRISFPPSKGCLLRCLWGLGRYIPSISVPKMIEKMRHDSSRAIIPGESEALRSHLQLRKQQGVRMNINRLGEAILGEAEARHRLAAYMDDLKSPDIEYISVKISTIYSQIQSLAFEHTVTLLTRRLSRLLFGSQRPPLCDAATAKQFPSL